MSLRWTKGRRIGFAGPTKYELREDGERDVMHVQAHGGKPGFFWYGAGVNTCRDEPQGLDEAKAAAKAHYLASRGTPSPGGPSHG